MDLFGIQIPRNKLDLFIRSVEISSFLPGRIRLYSKKLVGNEALAKEIQAQLRSFKELSEVETNTVTGSILIKYTPQLLHTNPDLTRVEEYIKANAKQ
ncbi:hypothetical protein TAMA11512_18500 [Selenomonas sp. TAMA-11512]|uniref:HMA2 domain-containing protein n=1 Tax=Selenomonas sp. TAMA-11512 TaxID=3095337 RepID=UPI003092D4C7|nr:hypothetical protein TAMA11512_18500 [Selenomonas sp. TAMA-11512]